MTSAAKKQWETLKLTNTYFVREDTRLKNIQRQVSWLM